MGTYSNIAIENDQFYSLEKHFEIACNRHPHLKLLESQWRFDQELVSKALQNISTIFPHYSRHDASHSKQIIVNIERMLGDKIKYLSATDTWLILEAAYHHDIGMVITQKQIEDMNSEEFKSFVSEIAKDEESELSEFAMNWLNEKAILPQNAEAHSFFHKYTQLLAEWYRRKHPYNSARIIRDPFDEIGLNSPRNELLPKRLFRVLSNICKAHGDNFEDVKKLPKAEAGMASEDCHPLYVACLIRMGDLLDVDDNRFCPVMMKMCGTHLPHSSSAHYHKHQSITHFRLDSEQIEITCECPTPDSYEIAFDWFNWLEIEYKNQTQYWSQIVPCVELGRLPTLITPRVKMHEPYLILDEGKRPDFKINQKVIMELVQGANLYSSDFDSIRELLQNSVDAIILRLWSESKSIIKIATNPLAKEITSLYSKYKVDTRIEYRNNERFLVIKDEGIGMDLSTIKFLMEVGSSRFNHKKVNEVSDMPLWFKPSGCFGIGFQSIFLISNEFVVTTKSKDSHSLILKVKKNNSGKLQISLENNYDIRDIGTTLELKLKKVEDRKIYRTWRRFLSTNPDFDFIKKGVKSDKYNDFILEVNISGFFRNSMINKSANLTLENSYFSKDTNILLSDIQFSVNNLDYYIDDSRVKIFFRGQIIDEQSMLCYEFQRYIKGDIDLYGYDAKEILNYSRESIINKHKEIIDNIYITLLGYIEERFESFVESEKHAAALLLISKFGDSVEKKYIDIAYDINSLSGLNYRDLINKLKFEGYSIIFSENNNEKIELTNKNVIEASLIDIIVINQFMKQEGYYSNIEYTHSSNRDEIFFSQSNDFPFSEQSFNYYLSKIDPWENNSRRRYMSAWADFEDLIVDTTLSATWIARPGINYDKAIMLPMIFEGEKFEFDESHDFNKWVHSHLLNKNIEYEDVVKRNKELIEFLKTKIL